MKEVRVWNDAEWVCMFVNDGNTQTTISLTYDEALDIAQKLAAPKGYRPVQIEHYNELWTERADLRHALWNLGRDCLPANIDTLEMIAEEIDCGSDCERGWTEHDTNAFNCRGMEDGTCGFSNAEELRQLAKSFRLVLAAESALSLLPTAEVRGAGVRELEWNRTNADGSIHIATALPGEYWAWELAGFGYWSWGSLVGREVHGGLEGAKAAAQTDYRNRILSSLSPSPAAPVGVGDGLRSISETMRDALEPFSDQAKFWSDKVWDETPLLEKDNLTVGDVRRAQKAIIEYHKWNAALSTPTPQPEEGEVAHRILGTLEDFAGMQPEEGEDWESWYRAAFDLARDKISRILASSRSSAEGGKE